VLPLIGAAPGEARISFSFNVGRLGDEEAAQ
jgi:hypothetical protein